jgi:hypothetical protein
MTMPSLGTLCHWAFAQNLGLFIVDQVSLGETCSCPVLKCDAPEFAKKCLSAVEVASNAADGEITRDLALIARYPPGSARLLVKRSKAKASKEFWGDTLEDADQVKMFFA